MEGEEIETGEKNFIVTALVIGVIAIVSLASSSCFFAPKALDMT